MASRMASRGARTWRGRTGYLLQPPGWREADTAPDPGPDTDTDTDTTQPPAKVSVTP
ncbi:hypothetical protein [Streptomyces sp. NPDC058773]|uniref:hypothetical protein n=1 Tax=Streptomyces sp. NPDC058773 TaxID=3346632 RepID=UPI003678EB96